MIVGEVVERHNVAQINAGYQAAVGSSPCGVYQFLLLVDVMGMVGRKQQFDCPLDYRDLKLRPCHRRYPAVDSIEQETQQTREVKER